MNTAHAQNSALYKLAPTHTLTTEQLALKQRLLTFCNTHQADEHAVFVINGAAGTGKSVLLASLFATIQTLSRQGNGPLAGTNNYLLVNHPEMLKLYQQIAGESAILMKKSFQRPTTFINRLLQTKTNVDITLVDEAHLLLTKADPYNHFKQDNQLDEIIKLSHITILVFDPQQVLKIKSYWQQQKLQTHLAKMPHETYQLTNQFRVQANPSVHNWINAFHQKRVLNAPKDAQFAFKVYADANQMYTQIKQDNQTKGLARMLATYDFPATLNDGQDHFVSTETFKLRWDRYQPTAKSYWAEREDSIEEVGSVYTIQGFDLNYAGIIIGPSVSYDPSTEQVVFRPDYYEDQAAFAGASQMAHSELAKQQIIANSLYVLMTRARNGLYLHAVDPALQTKLLSLFPGQ